MNTSQTTRLHILEDNQNGNLGTKTSWNIVDSHSSDYEDSIFCDITPCSSVKSTDVSEENVASIFIVEN
jgi:hypothetical protein